jgi:hypothetical protein
MDKQKSNAHGKYEKCLQRILSESMKEAGHLRNIGVNGKIIFKWSLIQYSVSMRIESVWLSICSCSELQVKRWDIS